MAGMDKMRERAAKAEQPTTPAPLSDDDGIATAAAFQSRFKTSTYTFIREETGEPVTVKFRALTPADDQSLRGSAVDLKMTEAGITDLDSKSKQRFLDNLSSAAQLELVIEGAKAVIIQASVRPKFTGLPEDACPPGKVSVESLTSNEILDWAAAIKKFSGVETDEETFRGDSETDAEDGGESVAGTEDEHADGGTDSEGVQSEPV